MPGENCHQKLDCLVKPNYVFLYGVDLELKCTILLCDDSVPVMYVLAL
jgi:hypothetical protein